MAVSVLVLALSVHQWRRATTTVCCGAFRSTPRVTASAADAPSASLGVQQVRPGDAIDTVGDGFADAELVDTVGDGRADTIIQLDQPTRAGLAELTSLSKERGPIVFNGVRGRATAESPAGITQAWSLDHADATTRESNWRTIADLASILVGFPSVVCELRGGTTQTQAPASAPLAEALGLDAEGEVDLIMEELAYLRASACRSALIDRGVSAAQLRVTADGRNRGMQVDLIPAGTLALPTDRPDPPPAPAPNQPPPLAAAVAPGDVVDTRGDAAADSLLVDSRGDAAADSLLVDSRGDGRADSAVPLSDALPCQAEANRFFSSPEFELYSVVATVVLLLTYALDQQPAAPHSWPPPPDAWSAGNSLAPPATWASGGGWEVRALLPAGPLPSTRDVEWTISAAFGLEFLGRWWAAGLRPKFLASPYTILDLLNLLPSALDMFAAASGADGLTGPLELLAPLRLLRAARILRLRRYFERDSFQRFSGWLPGGTPTEVQRVVARTVFSVLCIVLISAGVELELESSVNPGFGSYLDAIYFSVTTLTTVGFGDVVPITPAGRAVVTLEMLAAVTLIPSELAAVATVMGNEAAPQGPEATEAAGARLEPERGRGGERGAVQPRAAAGAAAPAGVRGADDRMRHVVCSSCTITSHEAGARFCRGCGAGLVLVDVADMRAMRDEARGAHQRMRSTALSPRSGADLTDSHVTDL